MNEKSRFLLLFWLGNQMLQELLKGPRRRGGRREGNSDHGNRSFYFSLVVDPALVPVMLDILS